MADIKLFKEWVSDANQVMLFFCGIQGETQKTLFVQLTDRNNNIAYEAETEVADTSASTLMDAMYKLFPDEFKDSGIDRPDITFFFFDGQRVAESGTMNIIDCEGLIPIWPRLLGFMYSFIAENGGAIKPGAEMPATT